jgi:hypothetical protein
MLVEIQARGGEGIVARDPDAQKYEISWIRANLDRPPRSGEWDKDSGTSQLEAVA